MNTESEKERQDRVRTPGWRRRGSKILLLCFLIPITGKLGWNLFRQVARIGGTPPRGGYPIPEGLIARTVEGAAGDELFTLFLWFSFTVLLTAIWPLLFLAFTGGPFVSRNAKGRRLIAGAPVLEIGIVWGIFVFFLLVAVPNFMPGTSGSTLSQAWRDLREIPPGLEAYFADLGSYPPAVNSLGLPVIDDPGGDGVSSGFVPWMLTTPVAYLESVPLDPYTPGGNRPFRYATNGTSCWIVSGCGPDGGYDLAIEEFPDPAKANCDEEKFLSMFHAAKGWVYDPTNGSTSTGDMYRTGP